MTATTATPHSRRRLYEMPEPAATPGAAPATETPTNLVEAELLPPANDGFDEKLRDTEAHRQAAAMQIVTRYAGYCSLAGLVPIPVLDNLTIGSLLVQMARELAKFYGIPMPARRTALSISVLLLGLGIPSLARWTASRLLSGIPLVGAAASLAGNAAMTGSVTYAVGKVLVYHFATGGNLFNFNAAKARVFFLETYRQAQANPAW
ncbi:MAG: hypothetical protein A2498_06230 [Lentisphaerae bacterium RIFOXYC12_FULL_60_16]|nr:MAG: hypothetical protein A2498_06230 [Lentisphaerae bacterium RIFOXYC12_FULL_60_16]OGV74308.1 MAG: hypothetical protein A2269_01945 [Lentisphaerae bacterium RIFOXYA12_FULL_60_10]OGV84245.1 MAG: hypothetical protein A2340_15975 [Lentisphaerae bacterium RIFOXYB12_FULL_60_10]